MQCPSDGVASACKALTKKILLCTSRTMVYSENKYHGNFYLFLIC